jgi:predicted NBD/HSP70 family sugar kinase
LQIALALQSEAVCAALINDRARVVAFAQATLSSQTTRAVNAALVKVIIELAHAEARGVSPITAIGLSLPGQLDPRSGRVSVPGWKHWTRVPLGELLEAQLDEAGYDIRRAVANSHARAERRASGQPPIILSTRPVACAAAESWVGAARGKHNVIYLSVAATIEAGILVNDRPLLGADGLAGAAAWLAAGEHFHRDYEAQGCLTAQAAQGALVRRVIEEYSGDARSMLGSLVKETPEQLTPELIVRAARGGEKLALQAVTGHCHWLGRGLANLISLLNPEVIVLDGELGLALAPFLDEIRDEAQRWAQPDAARTCRIVTATVKKHAELIGAARLATNTANG